MPVSVPLPKFCEKLFPYATFHWNRAIGCWDIWPKNDFEYGGRPPSRILKIFIFGHVTVIEFQVLLRTKFHQNRMIFRWHVATERFSRWQISAVLNFMGPRMGSLKTHVGLPIETIALNCLVLEKIAFYTHFGDRQTKGQINRQTDGQHRCQKPLSLSRAAA